MWHYLFWITAPIFLSVKEKDKQTDREYKMTTLIIIAAVIAAAFFCYATAWLVARPFINRQDKHFDEINRRNAVRYSNNRSSKWS
tara:strand:- start:5273 stop:5527 length:255 start_codon:yes stop_codon:yes gene_type:complete